MATNQYFSQKVRSEQHLYEDLVIESIKMMGQDVYYLPREVVHKDTIFSESILSRFEYAYKVEMYIESVEGFDGDGDLFSKFGVEIRDAATFVLARRRWNKEIATKEGYDSKKVYRPREGDVIYLPLSESIFEITKVDTESPFYQLSNLPVFKLRCELFEYSNEDFDTDIDNIDRVESLFAYQYVLTLDSADNGYIRGETVTQQFDNYNIKGEVVNWVSAEKKLYLAHVGSNDGLFREFTTTRNILGDLSMSVSTPTLVEQLQNIQESAKEEPFHISKLEFADWSEKNPFGDPT